MIKRGLALIVAVFAMVQLAGGTRLTLELPQGGDVFLALPLEDTDDGVRVLDLAEEAEPLVMPVENDQVVLSLSDGETVVLARA